MTILEGRKALELQHKLNSLNVEQLLQTAYFFLPYNIDFEWLAQYNKSVLVLVTIFNNGFRAMSKHQSNIIASNTLEKRTSAKKFKALICIVSHLITVIFEK